MKHEDKRGEIIHLKGQWLVNLFIILGWAPKKSRFCSALFERSTKELCIKVCGPNSPEVPEATNYPVSKRG